MLKIRYERIEVITVSSEDTTIKIVKMEKDIHYIKKSVDENAKVHSELKKMINDMIDEMRDGLNSKLDRSEFWKIVGFGGATITILLAVLGFILKIR